MLKVPKGDMFAYPQKSAGYWDKNRSQSLVSNFTFPSSAIVIIQL